MAHGEFGHAWFRPEDTPALLDVFAIYATDVRFTDLLQTLADESPSFRPVTAAILADWTPEVAARQRAVLAAAIQGSWRPYESALRDEAVRYARFGVRHWEHITRSVTRIVTTQLVEHFGAEPARLTRALVVMSSLLSRVRETVSQAYREHRDAEAQATELALERMRAEHVVRKAHDELEAFAYAVAHDLRTPLRGMNGFARILLDDHAAKLDEDGQACLRHICSNSLRMGETIDALLELARVGRAELRRERTDLSAMAREILDDLRAAEPHRVVDVVLEPVIVADVDPILARMLFGSLLGNAWKFTSRSPAARVELGRTADGLFLRDNGAGFDMDHADKLFAPFQRLHSSREFPGTGIGLATAQRILDLHGGRIWAEGKPGRGATFFLALPGLHGDSE